MFQTAEGPRPVSFDGVSEIESFEITPAGLAYMSINKDIGGIDQPVLASFDINTASTTDPNVIDLIGRTTSPWTAPRRHHGPVHQPPDRGPLRPLPRRAHRRGPAPDH